MSIRARLLIVLVGGFSILAAAIVALGVMTVTDYERMIARQDGVFLSTLDDERYNHLVTRTVMDSRGIYLARSPQDVTMFAESLNKNLDEMQVQIKAWRSNGASEQDTDLQGLIKSGEDFIAVRREVARLALSGDTKGAEALGTSNRGARMAYQETLDQMVTTSRAKMDASRAATQTYGRERIFSFVLTALSGLAVMLLLTLWMIARFVVAPAKAVAQAIIRTSQGDYDVKLQPGDDKTEMGLVWSALDVLRQRSQEAERFAAIQREAERNESMKLREIILD